MRDTTQPSIWKAATPTLLFYGGYLVAIALIMVLSEHGFNTRQQGMAMIVLLPVFSVVLLGKNLVQLFVLHQPHQVAVCLHLLVCLCVCALV